MAENSSDDETDQHLIDTTELSDAVGGTVEYPSGLPATWPQHDSGNTTPQRLQLTDHLPIGAIVLGGLMALVPLGLAVALMLTLFARGEAIDESTQDQVAPTSMPSAVTTAGPSASEAAAGEAAAGANDRFSTTAGSSTSETTGPATTVAPSAVGQDALRAGTPAGSGCSPGAGDLPDGVWFGFIINWGVDQIDFDLQCAYGGLPAISQQESLNQSIPVDARFYVVNDSAVVRTVPVGPAAKVRELLTTNGEVGPASAWSADPTTPGLRPETHQGRVWLAVDGGVVTEAAVIPDDLVTMAGSAQAEACSDIGMAVGTELEVVGIPADDPDGGLNVRQRPAIDAPLGLTIPNGTEVSLESPCQVSRDGYRWWKVFVGDGSGAGWAASEYLQTR